MSSLLETLHLQASASGVEPPNHASLILISNFLLAYAISSTRGIKAYYGFDHNTNPRLDVTKYGEKMIQKGKLTRSQLSQIQRIESSHANTIEHFPFLIATLLFGLHAHLPPSTINKFGFMYTLFRVGYCLSYTLISTHKLSIVRTIFWWSSNIACISTIVKAGKAINAAGFV